MSEPKWLKDAVIYQIYPQSFKDTNNDGIGDLPGIIEKLPYVESLGVTAIWLSPFYESPFQDAGYDVTDYYKVAPRYGTIEDFRHLCDAAHARGIKVICDLVAGHTSIECDWFRQSARAEKNEFTDRYIWSDSRETGGAHMNARDDYERDGQYYCNFFAIQPALNYGYAIPTEPWQMPCDAPACLETRKALVDVMEFWIAQGCDGFRVDMANSLVKNDPGYQQNIKLWQEIRALFDEKYPECVLISEWGEPENALEAGFHCDMTIGERHLFYLSLFRYEKDWSFDRTGHSYFRREGKGCVYDFSDGYQYLLSLTRDKGYICFITGNHDIQRISIGRDEEELKVAYAFIFTMPGVPFLYYGDEIGMHNTYNHETEGSKGRGGCRIPMAWKVKENAKNFGFSDGDTLYLPMDDAPDAPSVEKEESDPNSLLHMTRRLLALRHEHPALWADGDFTFLCQHSRYPLAFERSGGGERIRVFINPSEREQECYEKLPVKEVLLSYGATLENGIVRMGACSFIIYRVDE